MQCSICHKEIPAVGTWTTGNSAEPVNNGRCCDECNMSVVVPARLQEMQARKPGKGKASGAMPSLEREDIIAVRRALMNYIGIMERGELEGQQPDADNAWSDEYVQEEIDRCRALLDGQFKVTW